MQLLRFVLVNHGASPTFEIKIRLLLRFDFTGEGCQSHFIDPHAMMATTEVFNLWVLNFEVNCFAIHKIKSNLMN